MAWNVGARSVRTPSGQDWRVGRRWSRRRMPRWRKARLGETHPADVAEGFLSIPDLTDLDGLGIAFLALLTLAVAAFVIVPLLLFGIELILLGL